MVQNGELMSLRKSGNVNSLISKFAAGQYETSTSCPRIGQRRHTIVGVTMGIPDQFRSKPDPIFRSTIVQREACPKNVRNSPIQVKQTVPEPKATMQSSTTDERRSAILARKNRSASFLSRVIERRTSTLDPLPEKENVRESARESVNEKSPSLIFDSRRIQKDTSYYTENTSIISNRRLSLNITSLTSNQDKTKETTINDLKKRAELRKNDNFIKRVNSMPNGGHAATQSAREKFLAKIGEDPTKKVKLTRSNTFSSGGATGVKALLLKWCQARLRTYSVDVTNYSSSWADGSAFCGLVHSFFPDEFDWSAVHENAETEEKRRHNFNLAFDTALKRADAEPLIEVDDMIFMGNRPDAKCIFCYLQSLYNKLKKFEKLQKAEAEAEV